MNTLEEVKKIIKIFEASKIEYAILRNYKQLYQHKFFDFGDIDLVIRSKDLKKIKKILLEKKFVKEKICPLSKHVGFSKYIREDKKLLSFHFHLNGITGNHITYLKSNDLLKRKIRFKDFYVISQEDLFLLLLFHSLFDKSRFVDKYKKDLMDLSKNKLNIEYIKKMLSVQMGKKNAENVLKLTYAKKFNSLEKLRKKVRTHFILSRFGNIYQFVKVMSLGAIWKFLFVILTKADLISFIGMDGTGKTTITNEIMKILNKNKIRSKLVYTGRGKSNILPIQLVGQAYKKKEKIILKKEKKTSLIIKILYTIAAPVFALDLSLRYWIFIWPKRKKRNLVITDRYATDLLLMPNVPKFLKKFLYFFFQKPTKIIYLYNKPKVLHKRKKEHPLEDLIRQEKIFNVILKKTKPRPIKIKSENIDKTLDKVAEKTIMRLYP